MAYILILYIDIELLDYDQVFMAWKLLITGNMEEAKQLSREELFLSGNLATSSI